MLKRFLILLLLMPLWVLPTQANDLPKDCIDKLVSLKMPVVMPRYIPEGFKLKSCTLDTNGLQGYEIEFKGPKKSSITIRGAGAWGMGDLFINDKDYEIATLPKGFLTHQQQPVDDPAVEAKLPGGSYDYSVSSYRIAVGCDDFGTGCPKNTKKRRYFTDHIFDEKTKSWDYFLSIQYGSYRSELSKMIESLYYIPETAAFLNNVNKDVQDIQSRESTQL